jgi:hypothetical protein
MDAARIADELYGLPLDHFVPNRDRLAAEARKSKDSGLSQTLKTLAKPTLSAWVVNQMVRHHAEAIEQLLELGAALRKAEETLSGDELRQLSLQRAGVLNQLGKQAVALALKLGHSISEAVEKEIVATLGAAVADPEAARQVREGQLIHSLHYSGFGTLAGIVTGSTAASQRPEPSSNPPSETRTDPRLSSRAERHAEALKKLEAARQALQAAELEAAEVGLEAEAEEDLEHARQDTLKAVQEEREAEVLRQRAADLVVQLQTELLAAQSELDRAEARLKTTRASLEQARNQEETAARRLGELRS